MVDPVHRLLRFDRFVLDLTRGCLRAGAQEIDLRPKAFQLLTYLASNAGRLVSKQELYDAVWPDVLVGDNSLVQCIRELREKLGDDAHRLIKTVSRRGYLLDAPVSSGHVTSVQPRQSSSASIESLSAILPPDRPSIAVLPFTNLGGDPEQEYFADGMVEDIITELSRFRELFVVARNSTFQYKGKATDVRNVGRDLGVRYALEGSVRCAEARIRISAQLIDAETGGHLWAEKYDNDLVDIFALQDNVTQCVVGAIHPQILVGEGRRAARKSPTNLDAFDCCMRALWYQYQGTPDGNRHAESWVRRSIELDPTLVRAHVLLGRLLATRCWLGYSDDLERDLQGCLAAAERALMLDNRDAACHYVLALAKLMTRRYERALVAAQQAIDLNPNFALGHFVLGEIRVFAGQFAEALEPLMHCLRLSPLDPLASSFVNLVALAYYHLGNYDEAAKHSERSVRIRQTYIGLRTMVATFGQLGRTDQVHSIVDELERCKPMNAERRWELNCPYADPAHEAHLLQGLQKARLLVA